MPKAGPLALGLEIAHDAHGHITMPLPAPRVAQAAFMEKLSKKQEVPRKADGEARSRSQKRIVKGRSDPFAFSTLLTIQKVELVKL
jgi:hypothetical protein